MSPAPTLALPASASPVVAPAGSAQSTPVAVVPFMRASRKKNLKIAQYGPTPLTTSAQALVPISVTAVGWLRKIRLTIVGTTSGNAATVVFNPDAPFNILQQVMFLDASNDQLIQTIDGFTLAMINKYFAFASGTRDPLADPFFSVTAGAGATGGSFQFQIDIPVEVDSRDAFCVLENQAAQLQYRIQLYLNTIAAVYATAPTTPPQITITAALDYYATPAATSPSGNPQATAPIGAGSISTIQTQTPVITPSSTQNIQMLNVGNVIRGVMFILRNASGVRTEADFPAQSNIYVNTDVWYQKDKSQWRRDMAYNYRLPLAPTAIPTLNAQDAGVFVLTEFFNEGDAGDGEVNGSSDRNQYLVTGSQTGFNFEAQPWGPNANQFLIVSNVIRPSSPDALYAPHWS